MVGMADAARCSTVGGELVAVTAQIELESPRRRTRTAAQGLAGSDVAGPVPGTVDNADGEAVAALQLAQEGEQLRHFAAEVLVDETRLQLGDGLVEAGTVGLGRSPRSPSRNVSISSELDPLVTSTQR